MSSALPKLYLDRHGDTAWTDSSRHTCRTDVPLNERGEEHARQLGQRLRGFSFVQVVTSPLVRASQTCALAGFGAGAAVDPDLVEWDYGRYEGETTTDILKERPDWELFRDGCPAGESPGDVAARADRLLPHQFLDGRRRTVEGDTIVATPEEPPHHIGAHPAETDHSELHRCLRVKGPRISRRGRESQN